MKITDRSHRVALFVLVLIVAVALSTALLLAAERSVAGSGQQTSQTKRFEAVVSQMRWSTRHAG